MKRIIHVFHLQDHATAFRYAADFLVFIDNYKKSLGDKTTRHEFVCKTSTLDDFSLKLENVQSSLRESIPISYFSQYSRLVQYLDGQNDSAIIFHQLADPKLIINLCTKAKTVLRSSWMVWGGDLYAMVDLSDSLKSLILKLFDRFIKRSIIKKLKYVFSVPDDIDVARSHYGSFVRSGTAIYPHKLNSLLPAGVTNSKPRIMVGHSATDVNNHFKILDHLSTLYDGSFEIFCPLSYGDKEYAKQVIEKGIKAFSEDFIYTSEFLDANEYDKLLGLVTVAVFDSNRQSSIGNLARLIALKKKVFFGRNVSPQKFYLENGICLENVRDFYDQNLSQILHIDEAQVEENYANLIKLYSFENAVDIWDKVFQKC